MNFTVTTRSLPTLDQTLSDAEQLLIYATEAGIAIEPEVTQPIITATRGKAPPWESQEAGKLVSAIATLAAKVRPVTAQTLASCRNGACRDIRLYTLCALVLVAIIVPLSIASFITSGLSGAINADLTAANATVVLLHTELEAPQNSGKSAVITTDLAAPAASLTDLQLFATTVRATREHANDLQHFLFGVRIPDDSSTDDGAYELSPALGNFVKPLSNELEKKTKLYQDVRRHAKDVQEAISLYYGAIGAFVLPMLYASLGACAYLLRIFSKQLGSGSLSSEYDISARFLVALIGGLCVGLFNDFSITGASLSPLALAFLVGYGADIFFSFLDGLLQNFRKAA
jgi:hypothetical protein